MPEGNKKTDILNSYTTESHFLALYQFHAASIHLTKKILFSTLRLTDLYVGILYIF
jgi:hypothetical protein